MKLHLQEGVSGPTVNLELGELTAPSANIGATYGLGGKCEERKDVGKALSPEDEQRLLEAAD